jgi:hypothetical protein
MRPFLLLLFLSAGLVSCETAQTVRHKAPALPPEIQQVQNDVWDLQYQLYQAQHDLVIAQIAQKQAGLQAQKNSNPGAYAAQFMELNSKLEEIRTKAEQRYSLAQQWHSAVQSGDLESAQSFQQQMNQP